MNIGISDDWTTTDDALGGSITETVFGVDVGISDDWTTTDDALGSDTTLAETAGESVGSIAGNFSSGATTAAGAAGIGSSVRYLAVAIVGLIAVLVLGQLFDVQV